MQAWGHHVLRCTRCEVVGERKGRPGKGRVLQPRVGVRVERREVEEVGKGKF